jgi:hypothetical protein
MRRWNLLFLVALLAAVLIIPRGAMAATSPSTSFKGRAVAKNTDTHYFVVSFTCSPSGTTGTLSGGWTYEVSSTLSYTGTLGPAGCALVSVNGGATWSTSPDGTNRNPLTIPLLFGANNTKVGTLTLFLTDIGAQKTYFPDTTVTCPSTSNSPSRCIEVFTDVLSLKDAGAFSSLNGGYATLNLSVQ